MTSIRSSRIKLHPITDMHQGSTPTTRTDISELRWLTLHTLCFTVQYLTPSYGRNKRNPSACHHQLDENHTSKHTTNFLTTKNVSSTTSPNPPTRKRRTTGPFSWIRPHGTQHWLWRQSSVHLLIPHISLPLTCK